MHKLITGCLLSVDINVHIKTKQNVYLQTDMSKISCFTSNITRIPLQCELCWENDEDDKGKLRKWLPVKKILSNKNEFSFLFFLFSQTCISYPMSFQDCGADPSRRSCENTHSQGWCRRDTLFLTFDKLNSNQNRFNQSKSKFSPKSCLQQVLKKNHMCWFWYRIQADNCILWFSKWFLY